MVNEASTKRLKGMNRTKQLETLRVIASVAHIMPVFMYIITLQRRERTRGNQAGRKGDNEELEIRAWVDANITAACLRRCLFPFPAWTRRCMPANTYQMDIN
ncbi:hypothetical protein E2C01_032539 [Portunus trituberculatus]|uniref:Uncharacterized protein n=1 Tax=Portunus trituberculatus TaxID=210409 RepID=A0A5B7EVJ0_PORTR|nr:hypothetical protein [Portunus trituberculatus]